MSASPLVRQWTIDRYGRDNLRIDYAPLTEPRAGEVRVRVAAVALNARDLMMIDHGLDVVLHDGRAEL